MFCKECGSALEATDRFCPACGTPNVMARFHPKFDVGRFEEPVEEEIEVLEPGTPVCPRCHRRVEIDQHWCAACGMDLADAFRRLEFTQVGGLVRRPGPGMPYGYRPLGRIARTAQVILIVSTVVAIAAAVSDLLLYARSLDVRFGADLPSEGLVTLVKALDLALVTLFVAGWAVVAYWLAVGYRNLPAMGVSGLRFGMRWPVICWFVPVWNLFRPKQLMDDVWRASDPAAPPRSSSWRLVHVPLWTALWWPAALVGALGTGVTLAAAVTGFANLSRNDLGAALILGAIGAVALAAAAPSLLLLVQGATDRQRRRAEVLEEAIVERVPEPMVDADLPPVDLARHERLFGRY